MVADPYIMEHAAFIRMAREYRLTNSAEGRYGLGFVRGYVARCLKQAAIRRVCFQKDRNFSRLQQAVRWAA